MYKNFEKTRKKFWQTFYETSGSIFKKFNLRRDKNFDEIL